MRLPVSISAYLLLVAKTAAFSPLSSRISVSDYKNIGRKEARLMGVKLADGVEKELLVRGTGRAVEAGDILAVDYAAACVGDKPFAKSSKEQFILKDGSLIKGWDMAVSTM